MSVAIWVCGALIAAGAVLAIVRVERGPSILDRTVALDIVVTCLVAAVALYAALERRADVVPILVVLSLVGFVGSVTIARFAAVEPEDARRLRTREEVEAEEAARLADELAHLDEPLADELAEAGDEAEAPGGAGASVERGAAGGAGASGGYDEPNTASRVGDAPPPLKGGTPRDDEGSGR
jgi:multicomponent Na+:H+ antiporter subunit F